MGSFSIWHWLIVLVVITAIVLLIIAVGRRTKSHGLKGIYGWLLFFYIISAAAVISVPLAVYNDIKSAEALYPVLIGHPSWVAFKPWYIACTALTAISFLYLLYILKKNKGNPETRKTAIKIIWIAGALAPLIQLIAALVYFDAGLEEFAKTFGQGLVYAIVWSLYFHRSIRVKNTYG